jgi:predicted nucleotidyltransferase
MKETEKKILLDCAKKYGVKAMFLFGSSLDTKRKARDIDIGVTGVVPTLFFKLYGELIWRLPKPVDLVDISEPSLFNRLVLKEGIKIYG